MAENINFWDVVFNDCDGLESEDKGENKGENNDINNTEIENELYDVRGIFKKDNGLDDFTDEFADDEMDEVNTRIRKFMSELYQDTNELSHAKVERVKVERVKGHIKLKKSILPKICQRCNIRTTSNSEDLCFKCIKIRLFFRNPIQRYQMGII